MREAATGLTLPDACGGKEIQGSLGEGLFGLTVHEFMEGSGWSESGTWNIATAVCRAARKKITMFLTCS